MHAIAVFGVDNVDIFISIILCEPDSFQSKERAIHSELPSNLSVKINSRVLI